MSIIGYRTTPQQTNLNHSMRQRLNAPGWPCLIVACCYLIFITLRLTAGGNDPSFFVLASYRFVDAQQAPASLKVLPHWDGYDGQFFYRLALNPFTDKQTDFGIKLDLPPWRQQRIVYPTLVWLMSLGRAELVPWMLIAVNYAALCLMGWIGGKAAGSLGQHALWGLVFPLYPGFLFTLACDTSEIVEASLVLTSLWLLMRKRPRLATGALTLAVLTKDPALLVAVGAMMAYGLERLKQANDARIKWYYFVIPGTTFALWQLFLYSRWHQFPVLAGSSNLGWPLTDFVSLIARTFNLSEPFRSHAIAELIFVFVMVVLPLSLFRSSRAGLHLKVTWMLYGVLASTYTTMIWVADVSSLRALSDFYMFGMLILLSTSSNLKWPAVFYSACVWVYSFLPAIRLI